MKSQPAYKPQIPSIREAIADGANGAEQASAKGTPKPMRFERNATMSRDELAGTTSGHNARRRHRQHDDSSNEGDEGKRGNGGNGGNGGDRGDEGDKFPSPSAVCFQESVSTLYLNRS